MNTRILTVIPAGQMAHRASEGRIGDPDARGVAWQAVLCPDAGTHAVQVQRAAPPQNPHAKYRVTNWPDYDAALVRRGALTVWFTDEAIAEWRAPATGRRGGQPIYSALAIETALTIRLVFHSRCDRPKDCYDPLPMCSTSISAIPDHTTLSRRGVRPDSAAKRHPSDRAAAPGRGQSRSQNLRRRRMAGCEAWQSFTPTLA